MFVEKQTNPTLIRHAYTDPDTRIRVQLHTNIIVHIQNMARFWLSIDGNQDRLKGKAIKAFA